MRADDGAAGAGVVEGDVLQGVGRAGVGCDVVFGNVVLRGEDFDELHALGEVVAAALGGDGGDGAAGCVAGAERVLVEVDEDRVRGDGG